MTVLIPYRQPTFPLVLPYQFRFQGHMHMCTPVRIVFLRIHDRDRGHIYDGFHGRRALQNVDGAAHPHQDRAYQFGGAYLCRELAGDVRRRQVGENQPLAPPFSELNGYSS
jgi:hypothetical protein